MHSPIRILRVVGRMDRGGLETVIMNVYRLIDRSRVQYDFVVHSDREAAYEREIQGLGGRIFRAPAYRVVNHARYGHFWDQFFRAHPEYAVVHGHVRSTARLYLGMARCHGLATIAHSHNTSSGRGLKAFIKWMLQAHLARSADVLLACSRPAGEWLFGSSAVLQNRVFVVPNGLDVRSCDYDSHVRDRVRAELNLGGRWVVGHAGRFHPQKNHGFLLGLFKELRLRRPDAVLLLVGDGERRDRIERMAGNMGLGGSVLFAGARNDVSRWLQAMDVFVFPSLFEGFGNVVVEAQAAGLPCFVSDRVPREAILTDLVETLSLAAGAGAWASSMAESAGRHERRGRIGEIARLGYDAQASARWYEAFYSEVHGAHSQGLPLTPATIPSLAKLPGGRA